MAPPPAPTARPPTEPTKAVAAVPTSAAGAPLSPAVTARVGQVVALAEAGQFLALERGYFQEQGLDIQYSRFDSAAQMIPLLASDQLDVGTGAAGAGLFNALARGIPIRIAGPQARHYPGASGVHIMVRQDLVERGELQSYQDLRGRKVALNVRAAAPEYGLALALQKGALRLADVETVEMSFSDMVGAFANRAIDVAVQNEPAATQAATRGLAAKWKEMGDVSPGIQFTMVLYAPAFARQEAARRWMLAYMRGVRDYNDAFWKNQRRDEAVAILTRYTPVKDVGLYGQMGFAQIDPNGRVDEASLAAQLDWYRQQGHVTGAVDLKQAIDPSFVDLAVQRLGAYA